MKPTTMDLPGFLTEDACIKLQESLAGGIALQNNSYADEINTVAGVDLAYWNDEGEKAVCCIVVIDHKRKTVLEKVHASGPITFPYIPGCLGFRELPLVLEAVRKLTVQPDVYMFDGNGILHPRRMGLAAHASFYLDRPTLGVAKSYYKIGETDFVMPANEAGSFTNIIIGNETRGRAVRTHRDVKPVFVSAGNYMDLETATSLVLSMVQPDSHIPTPTRYADLETHLMRDALKSCREP